MSRNNKTFGRIILLITYSVIHPFSLSFNLHFCTVQLIVHNNFIIICFSLVSHMFRTPKLSCILVLLSKLYLHLPLKKILLKKTVRSKRVQGCLSYSNSISRSYISLPFIVSHNNFTYFSFYLIIVSLFFCIHVHHRSRSKSIKDNHFGLLVLTI